MSTLDVVVINPKLSSARSPSQLEDVVSDNPGLVWGEDRLPLCRVLHWRRRWLRRGAGIQQGLGCGNSVPVFDALVIQHIHQQPEGPQPTIHDQAPGGVERVVELLAAGTPERRVLLPTPDGGGIHTNGPGHSSLS